MREAAGESFASLWSWLCDVSKSAQTQIPLAIHSQSGDRDDWGRPSSQAIRALPFSRTFLRRVDNTLPRPLSDALRSLKPLGSDPAQVRQSRRSQWRIVHAVLTNGSTDTEACRLELGMSEYTFRVAAETGIRALRSALDHQSH